MPHEAGAKQGHQALSTLASGTGGRFSSAQNGDALGRALLAAALRQYPYQVFDANGVSHRRER